MTITLSAEQSQRWDEGGWLSLELEEDILEDVERQGIVDTVVVEDDRGNVLFALTPAAGRP